MHFSIGVAHNFHRAGQAISPVYKNMLDSSFNESISLSRSRGYMRGETGTVTFCIE